MILALALVLSSSFITYNYPIPAIIQKIIKEIYAREDVSRFADITQSDLLKLIDSTSLQMLGTEYWVFKVNTDVEVFVCRDINQSEVPFWLEVTGFNKTDGFIKNENVHYEVWRKIFKKGQINLGVNGFDRHRYTYFVALKALDKNEKLEINPIWPINQQSYQLKVGSYIYTDWDELTVTEFSNSLQNCRILPTSRGRSREAHLIKAFRETDHPSSHMADQILLSWRDDADISQHISWRTNKNIQSSALKYWMNDGRDTVVIPANREIITDFLLANDPIVHRFNVDVTGLMENTVYKYQILTSGSESEIRSFQTASKTQSFEFGWFGDMHNDTILAQLMPRWQNMYPKAAFYLQAGDLVNTGLYRDHWDQLLNATKTMTDAKPFMSVPGNHDSQEALFPSLYLSYLKYPNNGPDQLPPGLSYHFEYSNTLFLMLDAVTFQTEDQLKWLEKVLSNSTHTFKIAVFHFAPHTFESTYNDIIKLWEPIFIKYGIDIVFNGHFHYYHRTNEQQRPIYIMSVATKSKADYIKFKQGEYVQQKGYLYQHVKINGNKLHLVSVDSVGNIIDQLNLSKN